MFTNKPTKSPGAVEQMRRSLGVKIAFTAIPFHIQTFGYKAAHQEWKRVIVRGFRSIDANREKPYNLPSLSIYLLRIISVLQTLYIPFHTNISSFSHPLRWRTIRDCGHQCICCVIYGWSDGYSLRRRKKSFATGHNEKSLSIAQ